MTIHHHKRSLFDLATLYAQRGWSIIPTKEKKPAIKSWKRYQSQRPNDSELRDFFLDRSTDDVDGLAVILGRASDGLACRDFDRMETYNTWATEHSDLALILPTVETWRGKHVYFRGPDEFCKFDDGDGEYRGKAGHYCLVPESRHPSGHIYRWVIPLPEGSLPEIDPKEEGLFLCNTEDTDHSEDIDNTANTDHTANPDHSPLAPSAPSVLQAIEKALPTGAGQRNKMVFKLARCLKAIPELAKVDSFQLRQIVKKWHSRGRLPFITTKSFDDTWADFVYSWEKVKYPVGNGPIEDAFQRATLTNPPPHIAKLYDDPKVLLLVSFCRELQLLAGNKEFFLDCRTVGRLFNVDHSTAWRRLHMLVKDRILTAGKKGSMASGKANEYRYMADSK